MLILQNKEKQKLMVLLTSGDQEMRNLGMKIIDSKSFVRFSLNTLLFLNALIILAALTLGIYVNTTFKLGPYEPVLYATGIIFVIYMLMNIISVITFRQKYHSYIRRKLNYD